MNPLKKIGLIFVIVFIAILDIFVYWNNHLYYRARQEPNGEKRIKLLERSISFCPLNDLVFYELGKSYLDSGVTALSDSTSALSFVEKSVLNLRQSIRINPASPYSHIYLAQALGQLDILAPGKAAGPIEEYKKAADLAGEDGQIHRQVARFFLSRWPRLSPEDQEFTLDIMRKIAAKRAPDEISQLLNIWELNSGDYAIMEKVLPSDPQVFRQYARFLGEKSLSLGERQKFLAQAEALEFQRARRDFRSGELELFNFRVQAAYGHFQSVLNRLQSIQFYQNLLGQDLINSGDYLSLVRSTWLNLAKCRAEERAGLAEIEGYLLKFLALEDRPKEVSDLEAYLRRRGFLSQEPGRRFDDPSRLAFELWLGYKQTKYRDIIKLGGEIEDSFVVVPQKGKGDFVRILQLIGDSYQKIDFLYDGGDIYRKALAVDPTNLETLLRLRQNYERLGEEEQRQEIDRAIEKITSPPEISPGNSWIDKGKTFAQKLILEGNRIDLDLHFAGRNESVQPLISVFFNGQVVLEGYLEQNIVSLRIETKAGHNMLQVLSVNRPVILTKIAYRDGLEADNPQMLRSQN